MSDSILVTGASRGIGRAIALRLAAAGYCVVINYRSQQAQAEQVLARLSRRVGMHVCCPLT